MTGKTAKPHVAKQKAAKPVKPATTAKTAKPAKAVKTAAPKKVTAKVKAVKRVTTKPKTTTATSKKKASVKTPVTQKRSVTQTTPVAKTTTPAETAPATTAKTVKRKAVKKTPVAKAPAKTAAKPKASQLTALKAATPNVTTQAVAKPVTRAVAHPAADAVAKPAAKSTTKAGIKPATRVTQKAPKSLSKKIASGKKSAKAVRVTGASKKSNQTAPPKPSLVGVQAQLRDMEARLKAADTRNRNATKTLSGVVDALSSSSVKTNAAQKASLTRRFNALESQLDSIMVQTRAAVRSELGDLGAGGISELQAALTRAQTRVAQMEAAQTTALSKINRHLADLAMAVEARLEAEAKARQALSDKTDAALQSVHSRIDSVEDETADALKKIGDKIAEFADVIENRREGGDAKTAERLADLAAQTRQDFDQVQSTLMTRIQTLEILAEEKTSQPQPYMPMAANADNPRVEALGQQFGALQREIDQMRAQMRSLNSGATEPALDHPHMTTPQNTMQTSAQPRSAVPAALAALMPGGARAKHQQTDASGPTNVVPMNGSFSPDNPYAAAMGETPTPNGSQPIQAQPAQMAANPGQQNQPADAAKSSHIPQEFDPASFMAPSAPVAAPVAAPAPPALPPMAGLSAHGIAAPLPLNTGLQNPPAPQPKPVMPAPLASQLPDEPMHRAPAPVTTYSDPAYAESDGMRAERVVGTPERRTLPKLPAMPVTSRNLRVGLMATGVALVGLFAVTKILGADGTSLSETPVAQINTPQSVNQVPQEISSIMPAVPQILEPAQSLAAYGGYEAPDLNSGSLDTLEAAVTSGNAIAQFQMGLARLQQGQPDAAVKLIRLAANQNQPAAQYRLGKLYETGTGVEMDRGMARQLIERAARGGNRIAMHDLGLYHTEPGPDGLPDIAGAAKWFEQAADRGVVDSQYNLARLSETGQGVVQDLETAYFWYGVAAGQGDRQAAAQRDIIAPQLPDAARQSIEARVTAFTPKSVDQAANGVFPNLPWAKKKADQARADMTVKIREAQTLLTEIGFDIGGADGAMGPRTREAIRNFQSSNALPETGEVTDELISKLETAAGV